MPPQGKNAERRLLHTRGHIVQNFVGFYGYRYRYRNRYSHGDRYSHRNRQRKRNKKIIFFQKETDIENVKEKGIAADTGNEKEKAAPGQKAGGGAGCR